MTTTKKIDTAEYKTGMRKLAGAVCIVTSSGVGGAGGFTATAVCSVSAEPPTLLVCVNHESEMNAIIKANGVFAVNVLRNGQDWLANRFAGFDGTEVGERLQQGEWDTDNFRAPVLTDGLVSFVCQTVETKEMSTHTVLFGEVEAVNNTEQTEGLVYFNAAYQGI